MAENEHKSMYKYSEYTVKEINKVRKEAGMPALSLKTRNCLRCKKSFLSVSGANRMCTDCRYMQDPYWR